MPRTRGDALRTGAAVAGALVLLVVVALSARGLPRRGASPIRLDPETLAGYVVPTLRALYLLALAAAFYHWLVSRDTGRGRARGGSGRVSPWATLLALVLVAVVALSLGNFSERLEDLLALAPEPEEPVAEPEGSGLGGPAVGVVSSEAPGIDRGRGIGLTVAVLAAAGAAALLRRRRPDEDPETLRPVIPAGKTRDLPVPPASPTRPRDRVFAAYRRVENWSGRSGLDRNPAETVTRHLARLPVDRDDSRRLAALYNTARFSGHQVTTELADEAESTATRMCQDLP